jgi:hypothetical protein
MLLAYKGIRQLRALPSLPKKKPLQWLVSYNNIVTKKTVDTVVDEMRGRHFISRVEVQRLPGDSGVLPL